MNATKILLKALGGAALSVTELFHRLNSVLPVDQQIVAVPPDMLAVDALKKMKEHRFSQLPVVVGREVLGLFSYRSFANAVVTLGQSAPKNQRFNPLELLVEDCLEKPTFARVTDEFVEWFDFIDQFDSVLVGEPNRLQGIVTAMDILRYLYGVASPFVLIAEIELALRALIQLAVAPETLAACAKECLKDKYADQLPTRLEDMTFNDYVQIIGDGRSWDHFQTFMGGNRVAQGPSSNNCGISETSSFTSSAGSRWKNTRLSRLGENGCCSRRALPKHVERRPSNERHPLAEGIHRQRVPTSSGRVRSGILCPGRGAEATSHQRARYGEVFRGSSDHQLLASFWASSSSSRAGPFRLSLAMARHHRTRRCTCFAPTC